MMGMLKEFKDFAMRGNVVDLAIGVVIGGAFGKIVSSMVEKIVMPSIGYVTGGVDFSKHDIVLKTKPDGTPDIVLGVGSFATTVIDFVIIAFVIFLVVKALNSMKKKEEAAPTAPAEEVVLLREIRDSLKR